MSGFSGGGGLTVAERALLLGDNITSLTIGTTLTSADSHKAFNNTGSTAIVQVKLPAAADGIVFTFRVTDADGFRIRPNGSDDIYYGSFVTAVDQALESTVPGSSITLVAHDNGKWIADAAMGTWAIVEPWLPEADGTDAILFGDFLTEGGTNHYWHNGVQHAGLAAFLASLGGSFIRGTPGYHTNSSGLLVEVLSNVIRFDYDMATLAPKGILIEKAKTNYCLWNCDLTNAVWTKNNVTAAKNQTGADGVANSASSLTATAANGTVLQAITLASEARFQTAYVKRITGSGTIQMTMDNGATWTTVVLTGAWSRVSIPTQTIANPTVGFRIVTSGDAIAVQLVQNEEGAYASSPIFTTSGAEFRYGDVLILAVGTSGAPFAGYSNTEGTMVVEIVPRVIAAGAFPTTFHLAASGPNQNFIVGYFSGSNAQADIDAAGSNNTAGPVSPATQDVLNKFATAWKANDLASVLNGGAPATSGVATIPAVIEKLTLGAAYVGISETARGHITSFAYFPVRASNAALQALTT